MEKGCAPHHHKGFNLQQRSAAGDSQKYKALMLIQLQSQQMLLWTSLLAKAIIKQVTQYSSCA